MNEFREFHGGKSSDRGLQGCDTILYLHVVTNFSEEPTAPMFRL